VTGAPAPDPIFTEDEIEAARVLFAREAAFMMGAVAMDGLPDPDLPEVAFAGRSNVGKSSLINALVGMKKLARASNEPGRTREVNFFVLDGRLRLVDLPGYGWAKASKSTVKQFQSVGRDYLRGRPNLKRAYLLIDARHGLKDVDLEPMDAFDKAGEDPGRHRQAPRRLPPGAGHLLGKGLRHPRTPRRDRGGLRDPPGALNLFLPGEAGEDCWELP
jgi:ribosome biogenesis GTP-binding protein YsxC/EngB